MVTLEQARSKITNAVDHTLDTEQVPLSAALSRTLAIDVRAMIAVPPADNSAMDGFALNTADLNSGQTEFVVSQRIPAGVAPGPLASGTAARIFTGGEIPVGANAVVMQENCNYELGGKTLTVLKIAGAGENIRRRGQDIKHGALVSSKGSHLNPIVLASLAAIGCSKIDVYKRLRVAILSTGSELVEPGEALKAGQIYNSNRTMLTALCKQLGFDVIDCGIVDDTLKATKEALQQAAQKADVILSSGGVSVGEEDYIKPAIDALGEIKIWKIQMKPGKPVVWGKITTDGVEVPILGLPGNPVSSFVTFQLLGLPLLRALQGQQPMSPMVFNVVADFDRAKVSREEYIRVKLNADTVGITSAVAYNNQSSGVLSSLAWADGLVRQNIDQTIKRGEMVEFLPLRDALL